MWCWMIKNKKLLDSFATITLGEALKPIKDKISAIAYHCGEGQKEKYKTRLRANRSKRHPLVSKIESFIYDRYCKPAPKNRHTHTLNRNLRLRIESFSTINKEYAGMAFTIKDFLELANVVAKMIKIRIPTIIFTGKLTYF